MRNARQIKMKGGDKEHEGVNNERLKGLEKGMEWGPRVYAT